MTSKITKYDKATNDSYIMDEFDPQSEVIKYSYTSSRVVQPNFNNYNKQGKPKVIGYYTDWSQYDGRLDGDQTLTNRGRGVDLTLIDPCAFDKLIIGFAGCLGDLGEKKMLSMQLLLNLVVLIMDKLPFLIHGEIVNLGEIVDLRAG